MRLRCLVVCIHAAAVLAIGLVFLGETGTRGSDDFSKKHTDRLSLRNCSPEMHSDITFLLLLDIPVGWCPKKTLVVAVKL